jgi:hypothetical protein
MPGGAAAQSGLPEQIDEHVVAVALHQGLRLNSAPTYPPKAT